MGHLDLQALFGYLSGPLRELRLRQCTGMSIDNFVGIVTAKQWKLSNLTLDDAFSTTDRPTKHDYLVDLPNLSKLEVTAGSLAHDSLMFLGARLRHVTLRKGTLTASEVGYCLALMKPLKKITIAMKGVDCLPRDRVHLRASLDHFGSPARSLNLQS